MCGFLYINHTTIKLLLNAAAYTFPILPQAHVHGPSHTEGGGGVRVLGRRGFRWVETSPQYPASGAEGRTARGTHRKGFAQIRGLQAPCLQVSAPSGDSRPPLPTARSWVDPGGEGRGSVCSRARPALRPRPQSLRRPHSKEPPQPRPTLSHRLRPRPRPIGPSSPAPRLRPRLRLPRRPGPALPRLAEAPPPDPAREVQAEPRQPWVPASGSPPRQGVAPGRAPSHGDPRSEQPPFAAAQVKPPPLPGVWTPRPCLLPARGSQGPGGPGGPGGLGVPGVRAPPAQAPRGPATPRPSAARAQGLAFLFSPFPSFPSRMEMKGAHPGAGAGWLFLLGRIGKSFMYCYDF